jgi:hypothetical protein
MVEAVVMVVIGTIAGVFALGGLAGVIRGFGFFD